MWLRGYVLGARVPTLVARVSGFVVKNAGPTRERRVSWHVCILATNVNPVTAPRSGAVTDWPQCTASCSMAAAWL